MKEKEEEDQGLLTFRKMMKPPSPLLLQAEKPLVVGNDISSNVSSGKSDGDGVVGVTVGREKLDDFCKETSDLDTTNRGVVESKLSVLHEKQGMKNLVVSRSASGESSYNPVNARVGQNRDERMRIESRERDGSRAYKRKPRFAVEDVTFSHHDEEKLGGFKPSVGAVNGHGSRELDRICKPENYHGTRNYYYYNHGYERPSKFGGCNPADFPPDGYDYRRRTSRVTKHKSFYDSGYDKGGTRDDNWKRKRHDSPDGALDKKRLSRERYQSPPRRCQSSCGNDDRRRSWSPRGRNHCQSYAEDNKPVTVVVKGFSDKTTELDLYRILAKWGRIHHIRVIKQQDPSSGGLAFIEFPDMEEAKTMMDEIGYDGLMFDGKRLLFSFRQMNKRKSQSKHEKENQRKKRIKRAIARAAAAVQQQQHQPQPQPPLQPPFPLLQQSPPPPPPPQQQPPSLPLQLPLLQQQRPPPSPPQHEQPPTSMLQPLPLQQLPPLPPTPLLLQQQQPPTPHLQHHPSQLQVGELHQQQQQLLPSLPQQSQQRRQSRLHLQAQPPPQQSQQRRQQRQWRVFKKRKAIEWSAAEVQFLIEGYNRRKTAEYQMQWSSILNEGRHVFHHVRTPECLRKKWKRINIGAGEKASPDVPKEGVKSRHSGRMGKS